MKNKILVAFGGLMMVAGSFALSSYINAEHHRATCSGSKSCNACKNCKYCKHCAKDGGTCGVCK